jgi:hypothetical protein
VNALFARPSTSLLSVHKTWMPAPSAGMTVCGCLAYFAYLFRQTQPDQALERRLTLQQVLGVRAVHDAARSSAIAPLEQFGSDEQMFGAEQQAPNEEQSD